MILIDLKNAFDTIDHDILLQKRKAIRFSESTIKWIESYLSKRILLVNIEKKLSEFENIYCGAAQESILGPLLFVIYINYMLQAVTSTPLLYEDDLCILHQYKNVGQIQKRLNQGFENLRDWFVHNKFSMDKAKSILFASKRRAKSIC